MGVVSDREGREGRIREGVGNITIGFTCTLSYHPGMPGKLSMVMVMEHVDDAVQPCTQHTTLELDEPAREVLRYGTIPLTNIIRIILI